MHTDDRLLDGTVKAILIDSWDGEKLRFGILLGYLVSICCSVIANVSQQNRADGKALKCRLVKEIERFYDQQMEKSLDAAKASYEAGSIEYKATYMERL